MAVVVKIKEKSHITSFNRKKDSCRFGDIAEGAVPDIAVETIEFADIGRVEIDKAISVEVAGGGADGFAGIGNAGSGGLIKECTVFLIVQ